MRSFAIIPAAGGSTRLGQPKLLLPWQGGRLIEHVLEAWRQGGVDVRVVVVHPLDTELADVCRAAGATVCVPPTPPPEMKHAIDAGLALVREQFAPQATDVWLLAPADLPLLSAKLIQALLDAYRTEPAPIIAPQSADGRSGHPVLFAWTLSDGVSNFEHGAKDLLRRHPVRYLPWQDAQCFADVDTVEDYELLHSRYDLQIRS